MKTKVLFFAIIFFLPVIAVNLAHAQFNHRVTAKIPFEFYAGNAEMPAGNYYADIDVENRVVNLRSDNSRGGSFLMGMMSEPSNDENMELVFDHLGSSYFLRDLKGPDVDVQFPVQKAEVQLARGISPEQVVVAMNQF
jgi:hypothetical protein